MKKRFQFGKEVRNEDGFALVSVLLILAILTVIGVAATNTANFELKIVGNERQANQRFYAADSGWKQSGPFLNAKAAPPIIVNLTIISGSSYDWTDEYYQIVRNYGDGADGTLNDTFSANSEDGSIINVPYWYKMRYEDDIQATEFGAGYRDFQYEVICWADGVTEVETKINKVFRVGY